MTNLSKRQELIDRYSAELYKLCNEAKTKEGYEEAIKEGEKIRSIPILGGETEKVVRIPTYWAKYYLLLKYSSSLEEKKAFALEIENIYTFLTDPNNKVALLYLESVIWSNLLNDQERAGQLTDKMNRIIASESVSLTSILRLITSRIVKEMADENWPEAVKISKEIEVFPREILRHAENLRHTANIFSNWGASLIRGNIDVDKGRKNLFVAKDYYLREEAPPKGHLEGIENRLREADEKS